MPTLAHDMRPHARFARCPPRGHVSGFGRPRATDMQAFTRATICRCTCGAGRLKTRRARHGADGARPGRAHRPLCDALAALLNRAPAGTSPATTSAAMAQSGGRAARSRDADSLLDDLAVVIDALRGEPQRPAGAARPQPGRPGRGALRRRRPAPRRRAWWRAGRRAGAVVAGARPGHERRCSARCWRCSGRWRRSLRVATA